MAKVIYGSRNYKLMYSSIGYWVGLYIVLGQPNYADLFMANWTTTLYLSWVSYFFLFIIVKLTRTNIKLNNTIFEEQWF